MSYHVFCAPDGCAMEYCGAFASLAEAQAHAETEPAGLEESLWDTARAAGSCAGMTAPPSAAVEAEPISWHGASGWHCVCEASGPTWTPATSD